MEKKIIFLLCILLSQFLFLILISYTGEGTHFLGDTIHFLSNFLVTDFLGVVIFTIPIFLFWLGYFGLKEKFELTPFLHKTFAIFMLCFSLQILLLNTPLINSDWSGFLPRFFYALVIYFLGNEGKTSILSVALNLIICLAFLGLVLYNFNIKSRSIFSSLKKSTSRLKKLPEIFSQAKQANKKYLLSFKSFLQKVIHPVNINALKNENYKKQVSNKAFIYDQEITTLINQDLFSTTEQEKASGPIINNHLAYESKKNEESQSKPTIHSPVENNLEREQAILDLTNAHLFLHKSKNRANAANSSSDYSSKESNDLENHQAQEEYPQENMDNFSSNNFSSNNPSNNLIINENIRSEVLSYLADGTALAHNAQKKIDTLEKKKEINENIVKLENTIQEFGIHSKVVSVSIGPAITQYEMTLEPGVKISRIISLTDNLALSLGAKSVRIVAPIPGKTVIGIEIPNQIQEKILLREIVERDEFTKSKAHLPIALGASITGEAVIADLTTTPHLLVAGATGSGKSVCINAIICSLLLKLSPYQVRFVMIDPKMVELTIYNDIPHLLTPVITHYQQASLALKWVIKEMGNRYSLLEKHQVRSIASYNEVIKKRNIENSATNLEKGTIPYLVIVIDEFADLMMVARKEIEDSITRLAAMSRAVGIHLILATQRPSVDVITGIIKANFPSRIAFQVSSKVDSRTIIDMSGAEKLLGKGDMLLQSNTSSVLKRIQGTFLADEEVSKIIANLKSYSQTLKTIDFSLLDKSDNASNQENLDEFYNQALAIAKQEGRISTSFLQRRLKIGYNRAARIVDSFEKQGIVSSADGAKPRELLINN